MSKSPRRRPKLRTRKTAVKREAAAEKGAQQRRVTAAPRARSRRIGTLAPASELAATAGLAPLVRPGAADAVYAAAWSTGALKVGTIARRELMTLLVSPAAWFAAAAFAFLVSTFGFIGTVIPSGQATMTGVFAVVANVLVPMLVPLITMRALAEEQSVGTLELLLTSPVRDWELVVGKWLGVFTFYLLLIATTLVYVILLAFYVPDRFTISPAGISISIGALDFGQVAATYAGMLLAGGAAIAIGVLASCLTRSRLLALLISLGILLVVWYAGALLGFVVQTPASAAVDYVGAYDRYQSFSLGQVTLRDTLYFLTLTAAALLVTTQLLPSRRCR